MRHLTIVGLIAALAVLPGMPASATEHGLLVAANTVYTLGPDAVAVEVQMSLTNTLPDREEAGVTFQYFFDKVSLPLPAAAANIRATSATGRRLAVSTEPVSDQLMAVTIDLPSLLLYSQRQEISLTFDLRGSEPRSEAQIRVNEAYAWFVAWAYGDPGRSSVAVRVPSDYEVEWIGGPAFVEEGPDGFQLGVGGIENPDEWYLAVSARIDDKLESSIIPFDSGAVEVRRWPGDEEWSAFMDSTVRRSFPRLVEMIGQPWPDRRIEVVESYTPTIYGYAGWYLPDAGRIEVGEELDAHVILHEAAHVWFNTSLFDARWINEGLAEEFALQARLDSGLAGPNPPRSVGPEGKQALNRWEVPRFDREGVGDEEFYGYEASWLVTHELVAEIGTEGMAAVIAAALSDEIAYQGDGEVESVEPEDDWRRYLDLLQEVGGSERAEEIFREYVVTRLEEETLDDRAVARLEYGQIESLAGDWSLPMAIRRPMSDWDFAAARTAIAQATALLELRDEIDALAASLELDEPDLERSFESSETLNEVAVKMRSQEMALDAVAAAHGRFNQPRTLMERIGLVGVDVTDDLDQAGVAFEANDMEQAERSAGAVIAVLDRADDDGANRAAAAFGGAALVAGAGFGLVWRRRQAGSTTQTFSSPSD